MMLVAALGMLGTAQLAKAEAVQYAIPSVDPDWVESEVKYKTIDLSDADFTTPHPSAGRTIHAFRNFGMLYTKDGVEGKAYVMDCGARIEKCRWRYNRLDNNPVVPSKCIISTFIRRPAEIQRSGVGCSAGLRILNFYSSERKSPPRWKCTRGTTYMLCKLSGLYVRANFMDAQESAAYRQAMKSPVAECGRVDVPGFEKNAYVWGVTSGSCEALDSDAIIMQAARTMIQQEIALFDGYACLGSWSAAYSCEDEVGRCVLVQTSHNGWIARLGSGHYYKTADYTGC